jgi:hypothetical protein
LAKLKKSGEKSDAQRAGVSPVFARRRKLRKFIIILQQLGRIPSTTNAL